MNTKRLLLVACVAAASLRVMPLHAQEAHSSPPTQREKFAACARESTGLKADERREFMRECLRKHPAAGGEAAMPAEAAAGHPQACSAEADRRKLQGDERRAFLGACVRG